MKYIFETASKGHTSLSTIAKTHPYQAAISLEAPGGWTINHQTVNTAEDWLAIIDRQLLILRIKDAICISNVPDKTKNEAYKFTFYFTEDADRYQFQAAIFPNEHGSFGRTITASTERISRIQERQLKRFLETNGIAYALCREDGKTLSVTTNQQQDDWLIAMNVVENNFDTEVKSFIPRPKTDQFSGLRLVEHV